MSLGIAFEGPDAVGKNYLALATARMLMEECGIDVVITNFPQYHGFGGVIRRMNRGAAKKVFDSVRDPYDELRHRAAMFALDRALALLPIIAAQAEFPGAMFISDRGPDSNAVTAGYMCASNPGLDDSLLEKFLLDEMPVLDREFRAATNLKAILCLAQTSANGPTSEVGYREALDQLEATTAQEKAIEIYLRLLRENVIYTKIGGVWQDPGDLTIQVLQKAGIALQGGGIPKSEGKLVLIGPAEMAECIFNSVPATILQLDAEWREMSLDASDPNGKRKHRLDRTEMQISDVMGSCLQDKANLQTSMPNIVVQALTRLLSNYTCLLDIVRAAGGEPYAELLEHIKAIGSRES